MKKTKTVRKKKCCNESICKTQIWEHARSLMKKIMVTMFLTNNEWEWLVLKKRKKRKENDSVVMERVEFKESEKSDSYNNNWII